jgi:hypothetical protein
MDCIIIVIRRIGLCLILALSYYSGERATSGRTRVMQQDVRRLN